MAENSAAKDFVVRGEGPLRVPIEWGDERIMFHFRRLGDVLHWARTNDQTLRDTKLTSLRVAESVAGSGDYRHFATIDRNREGAWFVAHLVRTRAQ